MVVMRETVSNLVQFALKPWLYRHKSCSDTSTAISLAIMRWCGAESLKFDFRIQPTADVLSVWDRKQDPGWGLLTQISIHKVMYLDRYSRTIKVALHHSSRGISNCQTIPVDAEKPPWPCLQASDRAICVGFQYVSWFTLMPSRACLSNIFQRMRSSHWGVVNLTPIHLFSAAYWASLLQSSQEVSWQWDDKAGMVEASQEHCHIFSCHALLSESLVNHVAPWNVLIIWKFNQESSGVKHPSQCFLAFHWQCFCYELRDGQNFILCQCLICLYGLCSKWMTKGRTWDPQVASDSKKCKNMSSM